MNKRRIFHVWSLVWSTDGECIASGGRDHTTHVWRLT
jgi:WD40 repeat protein